MRQTQESQNYLTVAQRLVGRFCLLTFRGAYQTFMETHTKLLVFPQFAWGLHWH
jgi:hypothetical protein